MDKLIFVLMMDEGWVYAWAIAVYSSRDAKLQMQMRAVF